MDKNKLTIAVRHYQNGKTEYLTEIYELTYSNLFVYSQYIMKDKEKAEDLLQDTYVEVIKSIKNLKDPEAFLTWSKRIMYYLSCHMFGEAAKENVVSDENAAGLFETIEEEDRDYLPEEKYDSKEVGEIVREIIEELPFQQRMAMVFYYYDGMPLKQIAEIMDAPANTIKTRLHFGRKMVKKKIEEYEKKRGIKLHAIISAPFLKEALNADAENMLMSSSSSKNELLVRIVGQTGESSSVIDHVDDSINQTESLKAEKISIHNGDTVSGGKAPTGMSISKVIAVVAIICVVIAAGTGYTTSKQKEGAFNKKYGKYVGDYYWYGTEYVDYPYLSIKDTSKNRITVAMNNYGFSFEKRLKIKNGRIRFSITDEGGNIYSMTLRFTTKQDVNNGIYEVKDDTPIVINRVIEKNVSGINNTEEVVLVK